jgi:hypothetical protein
VLKYPCCALNLSHGAQNFCGMPYAYWVLNSSLTSNAVSDTSKFGSPIMGFFGHGLCAVGNEDCLVLFCFNSLELAK